MRWFDGKRTNIQWFYATKTQSSVSGLRLTLYPSQTLTVNLGLLNKQPVFEGV
ncbi:MAG: hypothetical protein SCK57_03725 [Bacillota bacterium]|nr:hypothetical protein [Bacillota bacterium]